MNTQLLIVYDPPGATRPLVLAAVQSGAAMHMAAQCAVYEARVRACQGELEAENVGFLERALHLLVPGFELPTHANEGLRVK